MAALSLEQAAIIVDEALAHGRKAAAAPLTVAVLDAGGHAIALKREDASGILRVEMAVGKAWGALGLGVSSRRIAEFADRRPSFAAALSSLSDGRFVPAPGGVLIRSHDGNIVGAVGISGDQSEVDEACAIHAVRKAGLTPDPAEPLPKPA